MTPDEVACFYTMLANYRLATDTSRIEIEDGAGPGAAWFGEFLRNELNTSMLIQWFRRIFSPTNLDQDTLAAIAVSSENADQFVDMVLENGQADENFQPLKPHLKAFADKLFSKRT